MLSRRNIRIKVMQMLYMKSKNEALTKGEIFQTYHQIIGMAYDAYLFNLMLFTKIAEYAVEDGRLRQEKHIKDKVDYSYTARLANNPLTLSLRNNFGLHGLFIKRKFNEWIDESDVRQIYKAFTEGEKYVTYFSNTEVNEEDDRAMLLDLYAFCQKNELFLALIDDHFPFWEEDKSLVVGAMKKTIKRLPVEENFYLDYEPQEETVEDFGLVLLRDVMKNDEEYLKEIKPRLRNWDADRIAAIDLMLLKMALSELVNFPSIPTKVTLNEFVEIAKKFSTDKSKEFVNGILDRMMKELAKDGTIKKMGRGLKDK